jgi:hypothetical protein
MREYENLLRIFLNLNNLLKTLILLINYLLTY